MCIASLCGQMLFCSLCSCTKTVVQHAGDYIVILFQSYCTWSESSMLFNQNFAVWETLEWGNEFVLQNAKRYKARLSRPDISQKWNWDIFDPARQNTAKMWFLLLSIYKRLNCEMDRCKRWSCFKILWLKCFHACVRGFNWEVALLKLGLMCKTILFLFRLHKILQRALDQV